MSIYGSEQSAAALAGVDKEVQFNDGGIAGADSFFRWDKNLRALFVGTPDTFANNPIGVGGSLDSYLQISIQNTSESPSASADIVAVPDNGTDADFYVDLGINSSQYNVEGDPSGPNDSYLAANGGNLLLFADTVGKVIKAYVESLEIFTIDTTGIKMAPGMFIEDHPEIYYGEGLPPDPTGLAEGTVFFKYEL